jgi:hypothetical protein
MSDSHTSSTPAGEPRPDPTSARTPIERIDVTVPADTDTQPPSAALRRAAALTPPFRLGNYDVRRELGRGGMGIVYEAEDLERKERVALKTLQFLDAAALDRFKREFRTLQDVVHRNLVQLYRLATDGPIWFFTMELVEGVDFLTYIREETTDAARQQRLRTALAQLAEGVAALHDAGKLHRDIKPRNVLVASDDRVVLLDFGLAADLGPDGLQASTRQHLLGTVAYMSPEQALGGQLTAASDWYSVGVMLYEAVTGSLPFHGPPLVALLDKQSREPAPPREVIPQVADDLNQLSVELLRKAPDARPSEREILGRLRTGLSEVASETLMPRPAASVFVGRTAELAVLGGAFADLRAGRAVTVLLHGKSGAGKSALAQHFLDGVEHVGGLVLAGRCYENEAVPYKALDALIDALCRHLRRLPPGQVEIYLPRHIRALTRVFPILGRVDTIARAPARPAETSDPHELRRLAFAALREMLSRLADRAPVVLCIDDLQWGDVDSAVLLGELLRPPDPPTVLLLLCFRSEERDTSVCLKTLLEAQRMLGDCRELVVDELSGSEAEELAARLLTDGPGARHTSIEAIARESGGNPLFVQQLVQYVQAGGGNLEDRLLRGEDVSLGSVVAARLGGLSAPARRLLELVAVAGRPLDQAVASSAVELGADEHRAIAVLRGARLIRGTGLSERERLEIYHDRIRETVVGTLSPAALEHYHRCLARSLEAAGETDAELLALHHHRAGQLDQAGVHYARAGERAALAMAFERALEHFRLALQFAPMDDPSRPLLRRRRADALANLGRCGEAGDEYLAAIPGSDALEVLRLQHKAAMFYLTGGRVEDGLTTLRTALQGVGLSLPTTLGRAIWTLIWRGLQLRLRGLGFRPRAEHEVPPLDLIRIDTCLWAAAGVSEFSPLFVAHFGALSILLALRAGERSRVLRALSTEASGLAVGNGLYSRRLRRVLERMAQLVREIGAPRAEAGVAALEGLVAYYRGQWRLAHESCRRALDLWRVHGCDSMWELVGTQEHNLLALANLGEGALLVREYETLMKNAEERGNAYAAANLAIYIGPLIYLGRDDPEGGRQLLARHASYWPRDRFLFPHWMIVNGEVSIDLYEGNARTAWERMAASWPQLKKTYVLHARALRGHLLFARARCAVAAAAAGVDPHGLLHQVARDCREMWRVRLPWAEPATLMLRGGSALCRGQREAALPLLEAAAAAFDRFEMRIYAAAVRRAVGALAGDAHGHDLIAKADGRMTEQDVVNPTRLTAFLVPGVRIAQGGSA